MPAFSNPDTTYRGTTGSVVPAAWTDVVNDDLNALEAQLALLPVRIQAAIVSFTTNGSGNATISLPVAFPTGMLSVVASFANGPGPNSIVQVINQALGSFGVTCWNGGSLALSAAFRIGWIAVGS